MPTFALIVVLFGNVFVLDHGLTSDDCRAELRNVPLSHCVEE